MLKTMVGFIFLSLLAVPALAEKCDVPISKQMRKCVSSEDCAMVDKACNGCDFDVVNKKHASKFEASKKRYCKEKKCADQGCESGNFQISCVKGSCLLKKKKKEFEYSL